MDDIGFLVDVLLEDVRALRSLAGVPSLDPARVGEEVDEVIRRYRLPPDLAAHVRAAALSRLEDVGPLSPYLSDPTVSEVIAAGGAPVQVERDGVLSFTDTVLEDEELELLGERIALRYGRPWDAGENQTLLVRLADGSRLRLVHRPMGYHTYLNVRRYLAHARTMEELVALRELPPEWADWIGRAVAAGFNIAVTGSTAAGKTTFLDAMVAAFVPRHRRILVAEEVRELHTSESHPNVAQLEASVLPGMTRAEAMRHVLTTALTMRPDVIVVGEVTGPEALEMVQAMNSGHPTYTTLHTRDARSALSRLTYMLRLAEPGMPHEVLHDQVRSAVDVIVHLRRLPDGRRRLDEIAEVLPPWEGGDPVRVIGRYDAGNDLWSPVLPMTPERQRRLEGAS